MVLSDLYLQRNEGVARILESMIIDQREHKYCTFGKTYIKYRKIVSEWIIEVCEYFNLHATTTHAAIAYLDRLQPNEKFSRNEWQMLAICCILISSKYNECEEHVPDFQTLGEITKQNIINDEVLSYELWALKKMRWKLAVYSPMAFLTAYSCVGVTFEEDSHLLCPSDNNNNSNDNQSNKENIENSSNNKNNDSDNIEREKEDVFTKTTTALATLCVLEPDFKQYPSSIVASAIIYTARKALRCNTIWRNELEILTTHTVNDIMPVVERIWCMYAPLVGLDPTAIFDEVLLQEKCNSSNSDSSSSGSKGSSSSSSSGSSVNTSEVPEIGVDADECDRTPTNKGKNNGLRVKLFTPEMDKSGGDNGCDNLVVEEKQSSPTSVLEVADVYENIIVGKVEAINVDVDIAPASSSINDLDCDINFARKLTYTATKTGNDVDVDIIKNSVNNKSDSNSVKASTNAENVDVDVNQWHLLNSEELDLIKNYRLAFM